MTLSRRAFLVSAAAAVAGAGCGRSGDRSAVPAGAASQGAAMTPSAIRLVTRGDDSGSCHAANAAVRDAFQKGILRNASVMAPGPAFDEAAAMLRDCRGLCIGLHATITDEWHQTRWGPVLGAKQAPTIVMEDGTFFKDTAELWNHPPGRRPDNDEIIAELQAQLRKMRAARLQVDYVDEHMGFNWFPGLDERLDAFARAEGLLRLRKKTTYLPDVKGEFTDPVERFLARLAAAEPGKTYLVVTHPAYDTEEIRAMCYGDRRPGEIARERDADRRMYMDPRVAARCRTRGIEPVRWTDLG